MNREIKFRAFDNATKKMYYKSGLTVSDNQIIHMDGQIMQFTGLKDKNGVDIYEGDICKWEDDGEYHIGVMFFNHDAAAFRIQMKQGYFPSFKLLSHHVEVVSNIYQNPELLT